VNSVANLEIGKKFSTSNPSLTSLFNGQLGDSYYYLKDYKKSDSAYEAVLKFDPDDDHVLNNYSYFLSLRKENLDYAEKLSAKLIEQHPNDPTYLDTRAWVLFNLGKVDEAKKVIEKALEHKDKITGDIVEHYGDILYKLGKSKEAMEQWKKAKEMGNSENPNRLDKKISQGKLYE
jgi:Tfp pilus assembly protein PilF